MESTSDGANLGAGPVQLFMQSHNMTVADVPVFVVVHTALSAILVSSTWYLCYVTMSRHNIMSQPTNALSKFCVAWIPETWRRNWTAQLVQLEASTTQSSWAQRLPASLDIPRLVISFCQAKLGRLFFKPITVPGRIWLSYKGTLAWRERQRGGGQHLDESNQINKNIQSSIKKDKHGEKISAKNIATRRSRWSIQTFDKKSPISNQSSMALIESQHTFLATGPFSKVHAPTITRRGSLC